MTCWAAGSGLVPIHCPEHGMVLLPSEYLLGAPWARRFLRHVSVRCLEPSAPLDMRDGLPVER